MASDAVLRWLGKNDSWLLVMDNADTPDLIAPFLPTDPRGHILLTSRAYSFDVLGLESLALETLPAEEAVAFLLKRARRGDPTEELEAAGE